MNKLVIALIAALSITGCSESQTATKLEISKDTCKAAAKWIDDQVADIVANKTETPVVALMNLPAELRRVNAILAQPISDLYSRESDIRFDAKSKSVTDLVTDIKTGVVGRCANLIGMTGSEDFGKTNICIAMHQVRAEEMERRFKDHERTLLDATDDLTDFQKNYKTFSIAALEDVYKSEIAADAEQLKRNKHEGQWMSDISCIQTYGSNL